MKEKLTELIKKYKYPLLIFVIGLCLLIPGGRSAEKEPSSDESVLLQQVLSRSEGVGEAKVIISENGVVVVCEGAEKAFVKYNILNAVRAYTGFSTDRITVLKLVK